MILPRDQIGRLLAGKRDLVLLASCGDAAPPHRAGSVVAVQPAATKRATCRVHVTRVTDIALRDLDDDRARRLGHVDLDALMASWVAEHGAWNENARAWLLAVAVDSEACEVFLARSTSQAYTTSPSMAVRESPQEGPVVALGPADLAAVSRSAHASARERYEQLLRERSRLPVAERLRRLTVDAELRGAQLGRDERVIEECVRAMERRVYRPAHLRAA